MRPQRLTERIPGHKLSQLTDGLTVPAQGKVGFDPSLRGEQPQLLEAGRQAPAWVSIGKVGERLTPPQVQGLTEKLRGRPRVPVAEGSGPGIDQPLESVRVDRTGIQTEAVAGRFGDDDLGSEPSSQLRNVTLEGPLRGRRWILSPQRLEQRHGGHRGADVHRQHGHDRTLLRRFDHHRRSTLVDLDRAEDPHPHGDDPTQWPTQPSHNGRTTTSGHGDFKADEDLWLERRTDS